MSFIHEPEPRVKKRSDVKVSFSLIYARSEIPVKIFSQSCQRLRHLRRFAAFIFFRGSC